MLHIFEVLAENATCGGLVFSVEIQKEHNSLGLTISGKEQVNQPIVISEITPGGIAERYVACMSYKSKKRNRNIQCVAVCCHRYMQVCNRESI